MKTTSNILFRRPRQTSKKLSHGFQVPSRLTYLQNELDDDVGASAISLGVTAEAGMTFNSQNALRSVRESARFQQHNSPRKSPVKIDNDKTPSALSASTDFDKFANIRRLYTKETSLPNVANQLRRSPR